MIISFYILPNSSENKICGQHNGEIKIKLRAKPIDGEANKAIIEYLSDIFDLTKKQIEIKRGELGRHKQIQFHVDETETARIKKILNNYLITPS